MSALIDSHVHIYPHYDAALALDAFIARIRAANAACGVMMLAEREGADQFAQWSEGRVPAGWHVSPSDATALVLRKPDQPDIVVVSGRQIACAERIEILALATRATFRDGTPAHQAVAASLAADALPALAWGVGKWLFKRARVVASLLDAFPAADLAIADPSLRPVFWPVPRPMAKAAAAGRRVLSGSDPLPPKDEAARIGQYADLAESAPLDLAKPLTPQILALLKEAPLRPVGQRAGLLEFLRRMA
ncbi:MAG: hypothetical protein ACOX9C_03080 [Kiritimatiellia bacterium]|jgi:hypothetical protein